MSLHNNTESRAAPILYNSRKQKTELDSTAKTSRQQPPQQTDRSIAGIGSTIRNTFSSFFTPSTPASSLIQTPRSFTFSSLSTLSRRGNQLLSNINLTSIRNSAGFLVTRGQEFLSASYQGIYHRIPYGRRRNALPQIVFEEKTEKEVAQKIGEEDLLKSLQEISAKSSRSLQEQFNAASLSIDRLSKINSSNAVQWISAAVGIAKVYNKAYEHLGYRARATDYFYSNRTDSLTGSYKELRKKIIKKIASSYVGKFNSLLSLQGGTLLNVQSLIKSAREQKNQSSLDQLSSHLSRMKSLFNDIIIQAKENILQRKNCKGIVFRVTNPRGVQHYLIGTVHEATAAMCDTAGTRMAFNRPVTRIITELNLEGMFATKVIRQKIYSEQHMKELPELMDVKIATEGIYTVIEQHGITPQIVPLETLEDQTSLIQRIEKIYSEDTYESFNSQTPKTVKKNQEKKNSDSRYQRFHNKMEAITFYFKKHFSRELLTYAMIDAHQEGNRSSLRSIIRQDPEEAYNLIFRTRNERWNRIIDPLLCDTDAEPTNVIVGAGHLVGPDAIYRDLIRRGCRVEILN